MQLAMFLTTAGAFSAIGGNAVAATPGRTSGQIVQSEPVPAFACADGSLVLQTFVLDRTVLTLTDGSGELVRRIRQVRIDGSFHPAD